ncbi:aquaporin, partial [Candidatus Saccharibacteria bacterium]|nr:aquaporin [Candidatus Saccharibacteria bacterium]
MATKKTGAKASSAKSAKDNSIIFRTPLGALLGEFIGTFILAAVVISVSGQPIFVLFALIAIVLAVGQLSGSHVNPAITFGAWVTHRITTLRALGYIVAQVLGAMLALVVLQWLVNGQPGQVNPLTGQAVAAELFKAE